jgi:hypothetical protein
VSAECYFCKFPDAPSPVDKPLGTRGDALGACKQCYSFACGHHATRDINGRGFVCVMCTPRLVHISAVAAAGPPTRVIAAEADLPRFSSVEDFISRMPTYDGPRLRAAIEKHELEPAKLRDRALHRAVASAGKDSRDLFVLSAVLNDSLGPAKNKAHPDVLAVSAALRKRAPR